MFGWGCAQQEGTAIMATLVPKRDLRKELAPLYNPSAQRPSIVDVPSFRFLMIDGQGNPNTSAAYADAVSALYTLSYTITFMLKRDAALQYTVMALQGLWWSDDMDSFAMGRKDLWSWTMMIMQPEEVTEGILAEARKQAVKKRDLPALQQVRLQEYREGLSAQIMYIGPYAAEGPTIAALHRFIQEQGYVPSGKHHEIYLSDPRRTAPERLKTVIRQPIARAQV